MKKFSFLMILIGLAFCLNACGPGYVAEEPVYIEGVRPMRPSPSHIWIEGNWNWNRRTHTYDHQDGNWALPNNNRRNYGQGQ